MATLSRLRARVKGLVHDDDSRLDTAAYDRCIEAALSDYSRHRPGSAYVEIAGNGTSDYDVATLLTGWVDEYSLVISIEYPAGSVPAEYLDRDEHSIYESPTGKSLRLLGYTPTASEALYVGYTIPRTIATVPQGDEEAFIWLAGSLALDELSTLHTQASDPIFSADSVDRKDKGYQYAMRAKAYLAKYRAHFGLRDGQDIAPAAAVSSTSIDYPGGEDRLTRTRRGRRTR